MSVLTLEVNAIKVISKGGGIYKGKKQSPTHYVIFNCPKCDRRNKQSMYEALYVPTNNERLPFKCKRCGTVVEVKPITLPADPAPPTKLLVTPEEFSQEMAQRRREIAAVNRSILGRP